MPDAGFTYLRKSQTLYNPITPVAALKAVETGLLPNDAFVYKANSVHPLFEEPIDLHAIERTLSRKDNDLSTKRLLVRILEQLLLNRDSEIALFAAESINAIENMYNERIENFKKKYKSENNPTQLRYIATQFYELALINESRKAIRNFYLFESYSYMKRYESVTRFSREDLVFTVRIMITLKSLKLARSVLVQALDRFPDDRELILLAAEIEYHRKNYAQVFTLFHRLRESWDSLPELAQENYRVWISES